VELTSPCGGELKNPAGVDVTALYSKAIFNYFAAKTVLPDLPDGKAVWMGFENDVLGGTGLIAFRFTKEAGVDKLYIWVGGLAKLISWEITGALPADAKTAYHVYSVVLTRGQAEFYIDRRLVAIVVNSPNLYFPPIDYPPYAVIKTEETFNTRAPALLEIEGYGAEVSWNISPFNLRLGHLPEHPPRVYRLYQTGFVGEPFAGKTVTAGTLISHPVPTFGYRGKTFYFTADQASTTDGLVLEVFTQAGNWRVLHSETYAADTLWKYRIVEEAVLVRLSYTPAVYPATVGDGEVVMV